MRWNRKVNQVWLVVLFSFVMVVQILWSTFQAVEDIERQVAHMISVDIR